MPIIDAHAFLGAPPESVRVGTMREVHQVMGAARISAVLLSSAQAESGDFRRGNDELEKALAQYLNVFGYVSVNPSYPEESAEEIRKRLANPLFKGVKLPRASAGDRVASEGFRAVLHAARRYGKPVLVETTNAADVRDVVTLAGEYQTIKFILGGMGETEWETAIRACEPVLNTLLEIGSLEADQDRLRDAVAACTPRRVLFGSHFPELHPMFVLGMVKDAAIEDSDRQRILYRNALELFELELEGETVEPRRAETKRAEPEGGPGGHH